MNQTKSHLLKKYNVPGPRYTSYPTVPYWETTPTQSQWVSSILKAISESEKSKTGAAFYVHIPFCQSLCTYCGCNTRITRNKSVGEPYVQTLLKELELYSRALERDSILTNELHLGGGTPTFLEPRELNELMNGLTKYLKRGENSEFSVEADPRVTSYDHLHALADLGFTRLSLGIQDFDPVVQAAVNRVQTEDRVRMVTKNARKLGFHSINYDLIFGLPFQNLKGIEQTVQAVIRLRPDRIAFYGYAHVPWIKPGQRRFTEADLPEGDQKRALYELGRELLEAAGYKEIGMDHFALETDSLWKASVSKTLHRNFMGYTSQQVAPLIGLGVSSIGDSWWAFSQNEKLLETYVSRVEKGEIPLFRGHLLNDEDLVIRRHILNLMTLYQTSWKDSELKTPYLDQIHEKLAELSQDELVRLTDHSCEVTELGKPFLRNICMAFDARLAKNAPKTQLFSKTV